MADTLPDFEAPSGSWIDAYAQTGIVLGTSILITNKSSYEILIQEKATQPAADNNDGKTLATISTGTYQATVSGTPSGVWLKSTGSVNALVNVQEV